MKTVPLHGKKAAGRVAFIDDEDHALISAYRWHVEERRCPNGRVAGPYASTKVRQDGREVRIGMHALITGFPMTDHRDGNGLNNQRSNLRPASKAQNNYNQRPQAGTSSAYKGVSWHKRDSKWQAEIKVGGMRRFLGYFTSEEEAANAYANAAMEIQGDYAYAARAVSPSADGAT